jgi:F-type H+-transporting ATPase subunit b
MQRKKCKTSSRTKTAGRAEREAMMKDAREIKDKMINDAKEEAQAEKYD